MMMQPYRIAVSSTSAPTCLSPPIRACPPPRPRWRRIELLLAGALTIAASTGAYAASVVGHGGHVEIAPTALLHTRAHRAPRKMISPPARTAPAREPPITSRPFLAGVHDPKQLLARAKTLSSFGLDLTIVETSLSHAFATWSADANDLWPSTLKPLYGAGHMIEAFELRGIPANSPLREAGFAEGDVLLGINGYDFEDQSLHRLDAREVEARAWVVAEVARGAHHVVLSIRWPAPPR